ncbi:MAG: hypothetical protein RBT63_01485, partial [Bdellovibrionales bacterium]|nr:hypothetical protein [Bdellovibrionales bacterium]
RVRSVAANGEISQFSKPVSVVVYKPKAIPKAPVQVPLRLAAPPPPVPPRTVAAVETQKIIEEPPPPIEEPPVIEKAVQPEPMRTESSRIRQSSRPIRAKIADRVRPWSATVEGGAFALLSTEHNYMGESGTGVGMFGVQLGYAKRANTARLGYRTQAFGIMGFADGQSISIMDAQYTYWWKLTQRSRNRVRLGLLGSYYRAASSGNERIIDTHQSLRTGFGLDVGLGRRWSLLGEVMVGTWFDNSGTYAMNGFVSYDLSDSIGLGLGYRLNLYDLGDDATTWSSQTYREAVGEAYSSLKFSF